MISVTCKAPVNIAVIKYWGKRDEKLILPYNDSISGTLSMEQMSAKTTVAVSDKFTRDRFWLNGVETDIAGSERLLNCLHAVRQLAESCPVADKSLLNKHLHIASENNFPTAAGLASSAAGYACLVHALACLYGVEHKDLTGIARQGSGSACRSLHGGFVHWLRGSEADGRDSRAVQVVPESHWPEMRVLVLVVNAGQKKVSSTGGMAITVQNSELFRHRVAHCVGERIERIKRAIGERDFATFAEITMKDSNQFHAVCLDSYPPIVYMNEVSHSVVRLVHKYNEHVGETRVAYTFDAGPNAVLYLLDKHVSEFVSLLMAAFPVGAEHGRDFVRGMPLDYLKPEPNAALPLNQIQYIIHTQLGDGAKRVHAAEEQSLLDEAGEPRRLAGSVEVEQHRKRLRPEGIKQQQSRRPDADGDESVDQQSDAPKSSAAAAAAASTSS